MSKGKEDDLAVVMRPIEKLNFHPMNPRKATPEAIAELAQSIKSNPRYFQARPVILSDRTGELVVIDGEQRTKAAASLGRKTVPTILMSGLTEEQEIEILTKGNSHAGIWDMAKLRRLKTQWGGAKVDSWTGLKAAKKAGNWAKDEDVEVKFSEVLNEEHNYIVLYFDNTVDWLQIATLLGLESVMAYSTREDGEINDGNKRIGVGRVMKGPEVLEKLKKAWKDENIG